MIPPLLIHDPQLINGYNGDQSWILGQVTKWSSNGFGNVLVNKVSSNLGKGYIEEKQEEPKTT